MRNSRWWRLGNLYHERPAKLLSTLLTTLLKKNMRKLLLGISLVMFLNTCDIKAQNLIDSTLYGQVLITKLRADYTPNQTLGYDNARDIMYSIIDNDGNNGVHGIYTDFTVYWTPGTDPSTNVYQNGTGINAEHVYPQSMGAENEPAKSDMHNLRPSRAAANSARGNCPFGEIQDANTDEWYRLAVKQNGIPTSNIEEWSEKENQNGCVFEPRESVKGDIARIVFYFFTIYSNADAGFFNGMKATLLTWHYADPVDAAEFDRSTQVKSYQGNHNPFVLDSTLARRAYFPTFTTATDEITEVAAESDIKIFPNPFVDKISFSIPVNYVLITDSKRSFVLKYDSEKQPIETLDVSNLPKGVYWIRYEAGEQKGNKTIIKQ